MKDQYFGDINDYRKYGLLRRLASAGLSIGVCWLLTRDDGGGEGELRTYLTKPSRWRRYDPELYERLQRLLQPGFQRSMRYASEWDLVPGATYFNEVVTDNQIQRGDYFCAAFRALRKCDVIFFDPDNGIEVQSTSRGKRGSARYIYWPELREAYGKGHSLLVYQHFHRVERTRFVRFLADRLRDELGAAQVTGFATPYVAFFLVEQAPHQESLDRAAAAVDSTWRGQIDISPPILEAGHTSEEQAPTTMVKAEGAVPTTFTAKQGQYLAFIYYYSKIQRVPPAEADFQEYFRVSAPAVHATILALEKRGLIERSPGKARSIRLRMSRSALPDLEWACCQRERGLTPLQPTSGIDTSVRFERLFGTARGRAAHR